MEVYSLTSTDQGASRSLALRAAHGITGLGADKRTGWANIARAGEWKGHPDGPFKITTEHLRDAVRAFESQRNPVPFDYEHASEFTFKAPAAGWVQKLALRGDALWALVEWTQEAADYIRNGQYRYSSSVLVFDAMDRKTGERTSCRLKSVGLTNTPFIDGLDAIALSDRARAKRALTKTGIVMNEEIPQEMEPAADPNAAIGARLVEASGMSAEDLMVALESNLDAVLAALSAVALADEPKEDEPKEEEEDEEKAALKATLKSLSERLKVFEDRELEAKRAARAAKVDALVNEKRIAMSDRAVYLRLAEKDEASFDAIAATLKPSYPVGREATAHTTAAPKSERAIALADAYRRAGVTDEKVIENRVALALSKEGL